jgi:poly(A) polymerase
MDIQEAATGIVKRLVQAGYTAYFAGGWVRDHLMQHPSNDIDIATDAPPEQILALFPNTLLIGLAFGVVIVLIDGMQFEVSTFRKDIDYTDGRRPSRIESSSPEEDAKRRDFTINGMFYDPLTHVIHDFVGGAEDIKRGIIRTIGDADERFREDRLRMIRAIRFAARFGFVIDQDTQEAILANAETLLPAVAMERVWHELNKITRSPRLDTAFIDLHRLGLLPVIFPSLAHVHLRDIKHRVASLAHFPADAPTILHLLQLFPDTSLEFRQEITTYLKASKHDLRFVELYTRAEKAIKQEISGHAPNIVQYVYLYAHPDWPLCLQSIATHYAFEDRIPLINLHEKRIKSLLPFIERVQQKRPLVNASMLQDLGVPSSRLMGKLLEEAERISIEQGNQDAESVLSQLKHSSLWPKE